MADLFFLYFLYRGQLEASSLPPKTWHSEVTVSVTGEPPSVVEEEETAKETDIDTIPEVIEPLSILDMLRISAVLEDTTDQLSILTYIMPVQYERRQSATMVYICSLFNLFFLFPSFIVPVSLNLTPEIATLSQINGYNNYLICGL